MQYNDNSGNPYSDVFWLAALVQSIGELEFGQQVFVTSMNPGHSGWLIACIFLLYAVFLFLLSFTLKYLVMDFWFCCVDHKSGWSFSFFLCSFTCTAFSDVSWMPVMWGSQGHFLPKLAFLLLRQRLPFRSLLTCLHIAEYCLFVIPSQASRSALAIW